jgi:ATP-binding cassette subfamily F protein uup
VLGLDGRGNAALFADYMQWEQWRERTAGIREQGSGIRKEATAAVVAGPAKKKLSYMEQREFDGIDALVEAADERLAAAKSRMEDPAVAVDAAALTESLAELEAAQEEHDRLLERWLELSEKAG